jgi:hypothetical protein
MNLYSTRSFPCPCRCGKEFTTYNESQNHINYCTHSPYQCKICDKGFIDEKPFLTHLIDSHPKELLKCFNKVQQSPQYSKQQYPPNYSNQSTVASTQGNSGSIPQRDESFNFFSNQHKCNSVETFPRTNSDNSYDNGGAAVPSCIVDVKYSNMKPNGSLYPNNSSINNFYKSDKNVKSYQNTPYSSMNANSQIKMMKCSEENKEYMFSN